MNTHITLALEIFNFYLVKANISVESILSLLRNSEVPNLLSPLGILVLLHIPSDMFCGSNFSLWRHFLSISLLIINSVIVLKNDNPAF
jgi:hypothetical protein